MTFEEAAKKLIEEAKKQNKKVEIRELESLLRCGMKIVVPESSIVTCNMDVMYKVSMYWEDLMMVADVLRFPRQQLIPLASGIKMG